MSKPSVVLSGALVRIYINNRVYNEAQAVSYTLDYGETEVYGIDSPFPQEIHSTRAMVAGSISGLRLRNSGGIQPFNARPKITDVIKAEYISLRIQDRSTGEDILFIPNAKVSKQSLQVQAKGVVRLSFDFKGLIGFEPMDRV
jgi:hypothetical protein